MAPASGLWSAGLTPELLGLDVILFSTSKTFRTELTDNWTGPSLTTRWNTWGTGQDSIAEDMKTKLWNQHPQKPEHQELRPKPSQADCLLHKNINTVSGSDQDPGPHNTIFKISRIQSKITGYMKHELFLISHGKRIYEWKHQDDGDLRITWPRL